VSVRVDVSFFIPEEYLPEEARGEVWKAGGRVALLGSGKAASAQSWIFQTWVEMRGRGRPVQLVKALPESGVVVALCGNLPPGLRPSAARFVVGVAADGLPHPGAQLDVLQNRRHARRLPGAVFVPHWPQPGLLPRDPARGDRFETVRFFGDPRNLAPALADPAFARELRSRHGLDFACVPPGLWHDYHETDAALAIRSLDRKPHLSKPATKLTNAWLAGVPFVGGPESAFLAEAAPCVHFLCCRTAGDAMRALGRLKQDAGLRRALVGEGTRAAGPFVPAGVAAAWERLLFESVPCRFARWTRLPDPVRRLLVLARTFALRVDRLLLR
jgi:hypothetical protein